MNQEDQAHLVIEALETEYEENKLSHYKPYLFQEKFHADGSIANQRLLMAANRVGKSYVGAMEMTIHLTGLYPDWWTGKNLKTP